MVITFSAILFGLAALIPPLRRNRFFLLEAALVVGSAYFVETHYFTARAFGAKTMLLFVVFHAFWINVTTFWAYGADKRAARRGEWRVPESNLHTLEFLGGWLGAWLAQKVFRHKTAKQSYQRIYKLMIIMEFAAFYVILKFLGLI